MSAVAATCMARVTPAMGIAPDASGAVRLRIVAFRAHCHCGFLGEKRDNWFSAARDGRIHRAQAAVVGAAT